MIRLFVILCAAAPLTVAHAADTVEPFDPGSLDVEVYAAFDGAGRAGDHQTVLGDMLAGWGLARGVSAYLGTTMQADGYLTGGETELALGLFGTMRDGDHVDLDLLLDLRSVSGVFSVTPSFELNLDHAPDMSTHGAYLRGGVTVAGRVTDAGPERVTDTTVTVGGYRTLRPGHQLLIEVDAAVVDLPAGGHRWEYGAVALGYNTVLTDALELINQLTVDIPEDGDDAGVGFLVGVIATLPGGGR